ncbi:MAG: hypothetical protein EXR76_13530 [Myxococcales bacterium]|nr:hypothetical protein [Myxococcales bacterium]
MFPSSHLAHRRLIRLPLVLALAACQAESDAVEPGPLDAPDAGPACPSGSPPAPISGVFAFPQAVVFAGAHLVVGSVDLDENYASRSGFLTVLDPSTGAVLNRIVTSQPNPQRLVVHGDRLFVVNTGRTEYSPDTGVTAKSRGSIDVIPLDALASAPRPHRSDEIAASADGTSGAPIDLVFVGERAYISSGLSNQIFIYNAANGTLERGIEDGPRFGSAEPALALGAVAAAGTLVYVADYNSDAIHLFDTTTETFSPCAVSVDDDPMMLAGPSSPLVEGDDLYVVLQGFQKVVKISRADLELVAAAPADACPSVAVTDVISPTGGIPNDLDALDDQLFVVHSMDNTVVAYENDGDLWTKSHQFDLPLGANPWHAAFSADGRYLAVTEWKNHAVSIFDRTCDDAVVRLTVQ